MGTDFDVIIVGGRCAGSPLAALLARQGVRVAVVERAAFPRDTLSTHIFEAPAINFLARLGVFDEVCATGAPPVRKVDLRQDDFCATARPPMRPGDRGAAMSVRRFKLDPILAAEAERSGAEMMMRTTVVDLMRASGRVSGVRVTREEGEQELSARLVVGADGRSSTVAGLVGARKYHVIPSERFCYWAFFENAALEAEPSLVFHRWDGRLVIATPTDSGLYQALVIPDDRFRDEFKADREAAFMNHVMACEPVAAILGDRARRVGKLQGIKRWEGYLRESAGSGWALVGDSGHFKDPTPGQGISDSFRQTEALAPAIIDGLAGSDAQLDDAVAGWARWRDLDAAPAHWMAADFGSAGRLPEVIPQMMRRMHRRGGLAPILDLFQHRSSMPQVFTPGRLMGATASLMIRPRGDGGRRAVLRDVGTLMGEDMRRRRATLRPVFVDPQTRSDAGETEVPESALLSA